MRNIFNIFKRDLKNICTNAMALILIVGIAVLPSLYAWFNIYANWDPYGSTGNMQVAVANMDEGTEIRSTKMNVGDQMVESLKANDAIDWQFVTEDEALAGVESGLYYAAIVVPKDFSSSLTSILSTKFVQPSIIYYANEKKNAIATKITDKVVQTVQTSVNESFITSVVDVLNSILGAVTDTSSSGNAIELVLSQVDSIRTEVKTLKKSLNGFSKAADLVESLSAGYNEEKLSEFITNSKQSVDDLADVITVTKSSLSGVSENAGTLIAGTVDSVDEIADILEDYENISDDAEAKERLESAATLASSTSSRLTSISSILSSINNSLPSKIDSVTDAVNTLDSTATTLSTLSDGINALLNGNGSEDAAELAKTARAASSTLSTLSSDYTTKIKPEIDAATTSLVNTLNDASDILEAANDAVPTLSSLIKELDTSTEALNSVIQSLSASLDTFITQLDTLSNAVESMTDSDSFNAFMNVISGNSEDLGSFLSSPVTVTTEKVYSIETYGSAMAPFYSTLAIWVGGIILVAILMTKVRKKSQLGNVKRHEEFFGRALLFELLGLIQGTIICVGDLLFLDIQCNHPFKFLLVGILAALIFDLFIYSLTYVFGNIGKAIAVILLVVQLGGSGGTFPIDVCPRFFRVIHPYLPFTFVINAMRECICETYKADYWIDILKLLAYLVLALLIGLLLKIPMEKPMRYFNKKIKETDVIE